MVQPYHLMYSEVKKNKLLNSKKIGESQNTMQADKAKHKGLQSDFIYLNPDTGKN